MFKTSFFKVADMSHDMSHSRVFSSLTVAYWSLLSHPSSLPLSAPVSLTVWCRTQLVIALSAPVSITVSGLALSRARAPSLPSSSPEAEAAGPGTGRLRRTLSRHRLAVSLAPSLCSSLPEAEATGPGDSSSPPASFAQPEAGPNLVNSNKFPSSFLFCFVAVFDFGAENITELE
ncbi:uncharacterized protein DS421_16g530260 [Arachis hypogaea]|nr:uncharacterized protein DS421_16g530260 [Arachis hypogaea]